MFHDFSFFIKIFKVRANFLPKTLQTETKKKIIICKNKHYCETNTFFSEYKKGIANNIVLP